MLKNAKAAPTMEELLAESTLQPMSVGDSIEAKVLSVARSEVWLDLGVFGAGLVAKREINPGLDLKPGDSVSALVIDPESDFGFPLLSLKKVSREKGWDSLIELANSQEIIVVYPYDANRGGLLIEVEGIRGFLPVSQLSAEHYPRVANADKDEILTRLQSLIKKPLRVRVIAADRDQAKLIVSEKAAAREDTKQKLAKIKVGDIVNGEVTGSVDFGIFVTVDGIEGLVHISEISWERVTSPTQLYKIGDQIKAKVIAIDNDKLSLSVKQLSDDPWIKEAAKLKAGQLVSGTIVRITPFGAFVQISKAMEALVHISELEGDEDSADKLVVGDKREFKILEIDSKARKITLTTKDQPAKTRSKVAKPKSAAKSTKS